MDSQSDNLAALTCTLNNCRITLKRWSRGKYDNERKNLRLLEAKLAILHLDHSSESMAELRKVHSKINVLLEKDDIRWKQMAKVEWLRYGDHNSKFYHSFANQRKRINHICRVKTDARITLHEENDIKAIFTNYFFQLFTSSSLEDIEACLSVINHVVTDDMNNSLHIHSRGSQNNSFLDVSL